jgi:hypothetical protein
MLDITTARLEIDERNRIRTDAKLPLLSPAKELRRRYVVDRGGEFEDFLRTSPLREMVEERLLARMRRLRGDPLWHPTGLLSGGGLAFSIRVRRTMWRIWRMQRRRVGKGGNEPRSPNERQFD